MNIYIYTYIHIPSGRLVRRRCKRPCCLFLGVGGWGGVTRFQKAASWALWGWGCQVEVEHCHNKFMFKIQVFMFLHSVMRLFENNCCKEKMENNWDSFWYLYGLLLAMVILVVIFQGTSVLWIFDVKFKFYLDTQFHFGGGFGHDYVDRFIVSQWLLGLRHCTVL